MKKFYFIALKQGRTCEGIVRADSIDLARRDLMQEGMEEINLALLRSDEVDFLDLSDEIEECANP